MQMRSLVVGHAEPDEVGVDELLHLLADPGALRVEAVVWRLRTIEASADGPMSSQSTVRSSFGRVGFRRVQCAVIGSSEGAGVGSSETVIASGQARQGRATFDSTRQSARQARRRVDRRRDDAHSRQQSS